MEHQPTLDFEQVEVKTAEPKQDLIPVTIESNYPQTVTKFKAGEKLQLPDIKCQLDAVLFHMQKEGSITSWQGFQDWGITRLSSIIHKLRHVYFIDVVSEDVHEENRFGHTICYSKYQVVKSETQS